MQWKTLSKTLSAGTTKAEIRSIIIPDELGNLKRHRVSTCWDPVKPKFSKSPAIGRLIKDKEGKIGVMVTGKNGANIKIGGMNSCVPYILVAINSISKKPRNLLLKEISIELHSEGNLIFGKEK